MVSRMIPFVKAMCKQCDDICLLERFSIHIRMKNLYIVQRRLETMRDLMFGIDIKNSIKNVGTKTSIKM